MNLNTATNEQLDAYREQIAKILAIDPLMLDYLWMDDSETGLRNRVLYAKRGAAEILRQNREINVTSLVPHESSGWIMFTATGKDKTGRQEIAVGAAYLEGQKADKRAHAVMTASTRAIRRLTLQFVGGGILDETEVQAQTTLQGPSAASAAQLAGTPTVLPPPQTPVSTAPGRDITPALADAPKSEPIPFVTAIIPAPTPTSEVDAQKKFEEGQQALRDEAQRQLADESKKKRTYRKRNTVDIASPGQTPSVPPVTAVVDESSRTITVTPQTGMHVAIPEGFKSMSTNADIPESRQSPTPTEYHVQLPPHVGTVVAVVPPAGVPAQDITTKVIPSPAPGVTSGATLSPEKTKEYRDRLSKYSQDILPKAGMMPSDGLGGVTMKLRAFGRLHTGAEVAKFTEDQFEDLLDFLDGYLKQNGAPALVEYINKALGVA